MLATCNIPYPHQSYPLDFCLQVPSQLVVRKIGAPIWLSVIVVAWGIVAAATAAMKNAGQFYMFRFLLGMCEAGEPLFVQPPYVIFMSPRRR